MTAALKIIAALAKKNVTTKNLQDLAKLGAVGENSNAVTEELLKNNILLSNLDSVLVLVPSFAGLEDQQILRFGDSVVGKACVDALEDGWHVLYQGVLAQRKMAKDRGGVIDLRYSAIISEYNRMQNIKIDEVVEYQEDSYRPKNVYVISDDEEEPPSKKPKNALVVSDDEEEPSDDDDTTTEHFTQDDDFGCEAADKRRHEHFLSCFSSKRKIIDIQ